MNRNTTIATAIIALIAVLAFFYWLGNATAGGDGNSKDATAKATATRTSTALPSATPAPTTATTGTMPAFAADVSHDTWTIKGTDRLDQNPVVKGWLGRLKDPDPAHWKTFPNIPNPDVPDFRVVNGSEVPDGMEYGVDNVPFCQQDMRCDFVVPAWHYRLITADYGFQGTECHGDGNKGCMLVLINVMDQSYIWRNQMADNGFTVAGRYWNGDALDMGVWGLVSHASANILGMETFAHPGEKLNSGNGDNGGANCGTPNACKSVDVTVVVQAGDTIIAVAKTTVNRP